MASVGKGRCFFRKLKYTVGLSNFHAYKSEYVKQAI